MSEGLREGRGEERGIVCFVGEKKVWWCRDEEAEVIRCGDSEGGELIEGAGGRWDLGEGSSP